MRLAPREAAGAAGRGPGWDGGGPRFAEDDFEAEGGEYDEYAEDEEYDDDFDAAAEEEDEPEEVPYEFAGRIRGQDMAKDRPP